MLVYELIETNNIDNLDDPSGQLEYYHDQISQYTKTKDEVLQYLRYLEDYNDNPHIKLEKERQLKQRLASANSSIRYYQKKAGVYERKIKQDTGDSLGYARFPKNVPYTDHHSDQRPSDDYDRKNNDYPLTDYNDEYSGIENDYDDPSFAAGMDELKKINRRKRNK